MLTISSASAGAGKTFLLTQTYIDMLFSAHLSRNAHRRILAVTFTKKATAEMKERIVKELSLIAQGKKSKIAFFLQTKHNLTYIDLQTHAQKILFDLLQDYGAFSVSTIDSFFQQVIRVFARELNIPGKFNLELDTQAIQQMAVDDFFLHLSANDKQTYQTLLSIIEQNLSDGKPWDPKATLINLACELFEEAVIRNQQQLFTFLQDTKRVDAYQEQLNTILRVYEADYNKLTSQTKQYFATHDLQYTDFSHGKSLFAVLDADLHTTCSKSPNSYWIKFISGESILKAKSPAYLAQHEDPLRILMQELYALLTGQRMHEFLTAQAILHKFSYLRLLGAIHTCIQDKNDELNRLPISDTNLLLNKVIQQDATSPFIYEKIGTRIQHFLIDEFQDTSHLQWENFRPLIENALATNQANLVVGDVKQSIYRFRNSDYSLMYQQIAQDFRGQAVHNPLSGNWRSSKQVVAFNNYLFQPLAATLSDELTHILPESNKALAQTLTNVYAHHTQTIERDNEELHEEGYVALHFIPEKKKEIRRQLILQQLPTLIADIQQRNIPLGRVACLVRNNRDALSIAQTLVEHGYKVMSSEGLLLTASPAVQTIIYTLKHQLSPNDAIIRLHLEHFAQLAGVNQLATANLQIDLFACIQQLIHDYHFTQQTAILPYLTALQDKVYEYTNRYSTDIYGFIEWWDNHSDSFALNMQQTDDAIQIVSIHKSKGLEYDVVIVPFCDWSKGTSAGYHENILWVQPKDALSQAFNVPLVPIVFKKELANSAFADDYYQELRDMYLDNLNLTYVAFTRAKEELYIFAAALEEGKKSSDIGQAIHSILQADCGAFTLQDNDNQHIYTIGTKQKRQPAPQQPTTAITTNATKQPQYDEHTLTPTNIIKHPSRQFFSSDYTPQFIGTIMHQALEQIGQQGDEKRVLQQLVQQGIVQTKQLPLLYKHFRTFWQLISEYHKEEWFDTQRYTTLNEQTILLTDGTTTRPDRILIDGKKAIVIDYKFGKMEDEQYTTQVRGYMKSLQSMGYQAEGYLCYVGLHKIVDVPLP